jgi:hypothetical protein
MKAKGASLDDVTLLRGWFLSLTGSVETYLDAFHGGWRLEAEISPGFTSVIPLAWFRALSYDSNAL